MQLDHINIRAPEELLETVRDFYRDVLGFEEGFRPDFRFRGYWLYAGGKPLIHLSAGSTAGAAFNTGHFDHIAFAVEELPPILARLDEAGVAYEKFSVEQLSLTQVFFKDPAGVKVELDYRMP